MFRPFELFGRFWALMGREWEKDNFKTTLEVSMEKHLIKSLSIAFFVLTNFEKIEKVEKCLKYPKMVH